MNKRITLTLILVLWIIQLIPQSTLGQKVDIQPDGQIIFNTISHFSSDQFLGRQPNTPEFFELQDWVVEQYEELSLEPAGEDGTFFQSVPIKRKYAVTYGVPRLIIDDREFFTRHEDFFIDTRSSQDTKISENVVFVGYGVSAPDKGLDEYANVDVKGKIVFALKGNPADFTPPAPRLMDPDTADNAEEEVDPEIWDEESLDSTKIATAYNHDAAGIILFDPSGKVNYRRRFRPVVEASPFENEFIIITEVSKQVFHWLFWTDEQMSARAFRTWFDAVRTDIRNKISRSFDTGITAEISGFTKTILKGEEFEDNNGRNIITKIPGTDPELKNQYVVIGAHFDHVGVSNGLIYNGAEDNASGSAVVFELARFMKQNNIQTKRTIILCLWTAEEKGLIGSRYWVDNPTDEVIIDSVIAYFNMDMVGIGNEIDAPGALNFPAIWDVIKRDQDPALLEIVKAKEGGPGGSDQTPFIILGIEAMALMTHGPGGHPDYHDTGDDGYKMNPEILQKTAQFVLQGTVNLGNDTETQLIIPGREHLFNGMYWPITTINPDIDTKKSWKWVDAKSAEDLSQLMLDEVKKLKQIDGNEDPNTAMRRRYGRTPRNTGVNGAEIISHDIGLMNLAKEILNFGRMDISADDPVWFNNGITKQGVSALKAMRKGNILLHLKNPNVETAMAVLNKARKPLLISGITDLNDSLVTLITKRKAVIAVDFDPANVERCFSQLETFKAKFDTTVNIFLNVTTGENLKQAKKELYLALIDKGWTKKEIYAIGGASESWRSQGNLDNLPGGRRPGPRR